MSGVARTAVLPTFLWIASAVLLGPVAQVAFAEGSEPAIGARPVLDDRYPERRVFFPNGVVGLADITYSALVGYRPLTLDLYRQEKASTPRPLVIYVHGGGWQSGHTRHSAA